VAAGCAFILGAEDEERGVLNTFSDDFPVAIPC
jgi:hypothetical protein